MKARSHIAICILTAGLFSCQQNNQQVEISNTDFNISVTQVESATKAHIRGLFMVNDTIAWASGSGGTFLKTTDGINWIADTISRYTHLDFRDIHAFDANTALLMAAGEEGRILRTEDGGSSWAEVYTRLDSGIFLDGMDFHGNNGICYGDPIDGKMEITQSADSGKTWTDISADLIPQALPSEAGFAASGTGVVVKQEKQWIANGGGSAARILYREDSQNTWKSSTTPLRSEEGCGIFSMVFISEMKGVIVGGCYLDSTNAIGNCAITSNGGLTWTLVEQNQPRGYRSCVAYSPGSSLLITCGRTGMDYSTDDGFSWQPLSNNGYYTCMLGDSTGWVMGKRGKMGKLSW